MFENKALDATKLAIAADPSAADYVIIDNAMHFLELMNITPLMMLAKEKAVEVKGILMDCDFDIGQIVIGVDDPQDDADEVAISLPTCDDVRSIVRGKLESIVIGSDVTAYVGASREPNIDVEYSVKAGAWVDVLADKLVWIEQCSTKGN